MEKTRADEIESCLRAFGEKRDAFASQLNQVMLDLKKIVEDNIDQMTEDLESRSLEMDDKIEKSLGLFKDLFARKKAADEREKKLAPVLELFRSGINL